MSGITRINKPLVLVDPETGLKMGEVSEGSVLKSGELVESQKRYLNSLDEKVKMDNPSVKLFPSTSEHVAKLLTFREIKFLFGIAVKYVCYEDSVLRLGGRTNGVPLDAVQLSELEHINISTLRCTISSLKKKQVLAYVTTGGDDLFSTVERGNVENKLLVMNPYIFMKGSCSCRKVLTVFSESIWKALYDGEVDAYELLRKQNK